jgi:mono/diheme cytochrome c family protein
LLNVTCPVHPEPVEGCAILITVLLLSCGGPRWEAPPESPAPDLESGTRAALREAAQQREEAFIEALEPGTRAKVRAARLARGTVEDFEAVGRELFSLDTPWSDGPAPTLQPLESKDGKSADSTRCLGCHRQGGMGGSGSYADLAYFGGDGDDALTAQPLLPKMIAGAALLELAGQQSTAPPFGWFPGRPQTLRAMVEWSAARHLGVKLSADELDALTVYLALLPPPAPVTPEFQSVAPRVRSGKERFVALGCAQCHQESLPVRATVLSLSGGRRLDLKSRLARDEQGAFTVTAWTDRKPHVVEDGKPAVLTPALWGVASRSMLWHDGRTSSLWDVIDLHGAEAAKARDAFRAADHPHQQDVVLFLQALGRPRRMELSR